MTDTDIILWDVDTQNDIILPTSPFAVPNAYKIAHRFKEAILSFEKSNRAIMGVVDAHVGYEIILGTRDADLPLHCIKGTRGQNKIEETQGQILYVSDHKYDEKALDIIVSEAKQGCRIYFEKQCQWSDSNPNIGPVLKKLGVKEAYLMGVLTNVCVKYADQMFKKLGIKTYLVTDAIMGNDFPGDTEEEAIKEMVKGGTGLYSYRNNSYGGKAH